MNHITKVAVFTVVCLISSTAMAVTSNASYTLYPPDRDLGDLNHYRNYTWGMDTPWDTSPDENNEYEQVIEATLSFNQIRNWDDNPNVLYIHLLDQARRGVSVNYDGQRGGDYFDGEGPELITYVNLPSTSQNLTYTFDQDELDTLNDYAYDGRFGLGLDPDCHFYNCGVQLDVVTEMGTGPVVPEPATITLLLAGGLAVIRRKRRK
ncbi:MAG: PEP-CTERM sorting domain-containing protein [Phycisphaerae bacterium]|jgi:hypothetical protein|nr:PEP-CTERM sorting domain-containing protein [Phycisphaerae bacterium]